MNHGAIIIRGIEEWDGKDACRSAPPVRLADARWPKTSSHTKTSRKCPTKTSCTAHRLTGKPRPRLCYLPTASADSPALSRNFRRNCAGLSLTPHVQRSFIESTTQTESWAEALLAMDGIIASGGNTLNQQAIWRAQGIDLVLREAWERGIILGGASAGGLCWFQEGTTDSRPQVLTRVECLGFLPGSHCPHYDVEAERRPTYHRLIEAGELATGIACDNGAGVLFHGTEVARVYAAKPSARVFRVERQGGAVVETVLDATPLQKAPKRHWWQGRLSLPV